MIETSRLTLRRPTHDDMGELIAINAHPDIERYMDRFGPEEAEAWLARVDRCWNEHGYGRMVIAETLNGQVLGRTGLQFFDDLGDTELGWTIRRESWGAGFATEAARAVAGWAFASFDLDHLISLIEPGNERSVRVARRLGMTNVRTTSWSNRTFEVHALTREQFSARTSDAVI